MSLSRPVLEYADVVWNNLSQADEDDLGKIQLEAARTIYGGTKLNCLYIINLYTETGLEPSKERRRKQAHNVL